MGTKPSTVPVRKRYRYIQYILVPVHTVPVLTEYCTTQRYGRIPTDAVGRARPHRSSGSVATSRQRPGRRRAVRAKGGLHNRPGLQGQSVPGSVEIGAIATLHEFAAPLDRRSAHATPRRRSILCSLFRCVVHSPYLHPNRFIIPPSTP